MASFALERDLTKQSVGYLSKDDYKRNREELEQEQALQALKKIAGGASPPKAVAAPDDEEPPSEKKKKRKKKKAAVGALSFGDELEEDEAESSPTVAKAKMGKCQDVDSSFLKRNAREEEEEAERRDAAVLEILEQQRRAKAEVISLSYSFRSETTHRELGADHRGTVQIKRGFTADEAAAAVRADVEALGGKFAPQTVQGIREERDVVLIACCEGVPTGSFLIPGAVTLVELATRRWSDDKATPIFDDLKHGVVVCERRWFEASRHTFPYNHRRAYDGGRMGLLRPLAGGLRRHVALCGRRGDDVGQHDDQPCQNA